MKLLAGLVALAACGNAAPAKPDAPVVADATPDGLPSDAGPITVHAPYLDASNRITPGATVLFYDDRNAVVDRVVTDAEGSATGIGRRGGMVLVLPPSTARADYYSWYSVNPGEELTTQRVPVPSAATVGPRHVTVLMHRYFNDWTHYAVGAVGLAAATTVSAGSDDIVLDTTLDADAPTIGDVVAKSTDSSGNSVEYLVAHAVRFDTDLIDLRGVQWGGAGAFTWETLPRSDASYHATWLTGDYERLSGARVLWKEPAEVSQSNGGFTKLSCAYPPGAGDGSAFVMSYQMDDGSSWALSYNAPSAGMVNPPLAPLAMDISRDSVNAISWTRSSGSFELGIEIMLARPGAAWRILMPPGRTDFTPPPIPSDLQEPPAMSDVHVTYVGGNDPAGYAALRTDPDAFDLYRWAQVMPVASSVYRFGGSYPTPQ